MEAYQVLWDKGTAAPVEAIEIIKEFDGWVIGRFQGDEKICENLLNSNLPHAKNFIVEKQSFSPKAFFFDMDSTVIQNECIVELSKLAGTSDEVKRITEEAMEGKMDFEEALRRRVKTLKGVDAGCFQGVFESFNYSSGMISLAESMTTRKVPYFLISGGFTELAEKVGGKLGFHELKSNFLVEKSGKLTGELYGDIVDADFKAHWVKQKCDELRIDSTEVIAVGDGANDIPMMKFAGSAVGFSPKKILHDHVNGVVKDHQAIADFYL